MYTRTSVTHVEQAPLMVRQALSFKALLLFLSFCLIEHSSAYTSVHYFIVYSNHSNTIQLNELDRLATIYISGPFKIPSNKFIIFEAVTS